MSWEDYKITLQKMKAFLSKRKLQTVEESSAEEADFTRIDLEGPGGKNEINGVDESMFDFLTAYDKYHHDVNKFLAIPGNAGSLFIYEQIRDDFSFWFFRKCESFSEALEMYIGESSQHFDASKGEKRALVVLLSHMYASCEIGKRV